MILARLVHISCRGGTQKFALISNLKVLTTHSEFNASERHNPTLKRPTAAEEADTLKKIFAARRKKEK